MTFRSLLSKSISRAIFVSLLLTASPFALVRAQNADDLSAIPEDSIPWLRGVAVSADVVGLLEQAFGSFGQYELAARVNLKDRYFPVVEVGYGMADASDMTTGVRFKTKAPYYKVGADFNLMKNKHDIYRLYVGARYGLSIFNYDITAPEQTDPVWGDVVPFGVQGASSTWHWVEAVAGVDAKIWGPLRLGWSVRYRNRVASRDGGTPRHSDNGGTSRLSDGSRPWYVPGFGRGKNSALGGTFNIIIEI